jgi:hypothetical protein
MGVEMPTRPRIAGVERRVYALVASLPFCGAQTAHFSFDMTLEAFLEGHVRVFDWLGGVPRECVDDNLRSVVANRDRRQRSRSVRTRRYRNAVSLRISVPAGSSSTAVAGSCTELSVINRATSAPASSLSFARIGRPSQLSIDHRTVWCRSGRRAPIGTHVTIAER